MKKAYSQRSDAEKVQSNWNKTLGLFRRKEYSVAVIRAATTVELAANLVVRAELIEKRDLPVSFVDSLLRWANGLHGKIHKIILPLLEGLPEHEVFEGMAKEIPKITRERNTVVHSGTFKRQKTALETLGTARKLVLGFVAPYEPDFDLKRLRDPASPPSQ